MLNSEGLFAPVTSFKNCQFYPTATLTTYVPNSQLNVTIPDHSPSFKWTLCPEDGSSLLLRNVGIYIQGRTLQPRTTVTSSLS